MFFNSFVYGGILAAPLMVLGAPATKPASASKGFKLVDDYRGNDFFKDWDFFTARDPTHGTVTYVSEKVAQQKNLISTEGGIARISVDNSTDLKFAQPRDSVRITSKKAYDNGLFVFDVISMPTGASMWPAAWTVGQDWPKNGEIDVVEGVNFDDINQSTLHTAPGCKTDTSNKLAQFSVKKINAKVLGTNCDAKATGNSGCGFKDNTKGSFGAAMNKQGGAVFAMNWEDEGISVYTFPRGSVPKDLEDKKPNPATWDPKFKKAAWSSASCDTRKFFKQHNIVINTSLCGDFAGNAFPGGMKACQAAVQKKENFKDAVWRFNAITVYQE